MAEIAQLCQGRAHAIQPGLPFPAPALRLLGTAGRNPEATSSDHHDDANAWFSYHLPVTVECLSRIWSSLPANNMELFTVPIEHMRKLRHGAVPT